MSTIIALAVTFAIIFLLVRLFAKMTSAKIGMGILGLILVCVPWPIVLTKVTSTITSSVFAAGTVIGILLLVWDIGKAGRARKDT